jgi:hypothetical protein
MDNDRDIGMEKSSSCRTKEYVSSGSVAEAKARERARVWTRANFMIASVE